MNGNLSLQMADLARRLGETDSRLGAQIGGVDARLGAIETRIDALGTTLMWKVVPILLTGMALLIGLATWLARAFG